MIETLKSAFLWGITRIAFLGVTLVPLMAAAVYFVVNNSLRGVEVAIASTNARFSDVNERISISEKNVIQTLNHRIDLFEREMRAEFTGMKDFVRKVDLENQNLSLSVATLKDNVEIVFLISQNTVSLSEFVKQPQFTALRAAINTKQNIRTGDIKIIPLIDDRQLGLINASGRSIDNYIFGSWMDSNSMKQVSNSLRDCYAIKPLNNRNLYLQTTGKAVLMQDAIGCPISIASPR